jgi:hypothetical protein
MFSDSVIVDGSITTLNMMHPFAALNAFNSGAV